MDVGMNKESINGYDTYHNIIDNNVKMVYDVMYTYGNKVKFNSYNLYVVAEDGRTVHKSTFIFNILEDIDLDELTFLPDNVKVTKYDDLVILKRENF